MAQEAEHSLDTLALLLDRLAGAASLLEETVGRLEEQHITMSGQVQKIVATVEQVPNGSNAAGIDRINELEKKLQEAAMHIAELRAQGSSSVSSGRKTVTAATVSLLAKQGISSLESIEASSLDAALSGISIEQRIAVKSQLLRAGLLS